MRGVMRRHLGGGALWTGVKAVATAALLTAAFLVLVATTGLNVLAVAE